MINPVSSITSLSAAEIAQKIANGELSAHEVVEAHIQRVEQVNPLLNAVVVPLYEQALAVADKADAARIRGNKRGLLHGVPITVKECLDVKGTPSTWGLASQMKHQANEDDPCVAALRRSGAIVIGKTNVPQLLMYQESDNPVYGRTNNPWDLENRTPGGSSGGEAAIIAACGSPLGIGTDIGGSIRTPAHFTGIHGLKPTSGRIMMRPPSDDLNFLTMEAGMMAQPGPLARSVQDLTLAMQALTVGDPRGIPAIHPEDVNVEGMRIAVYDGDGIYPVSHSIRRAVKEAADALRGYGAIVEPATPPALDLVTAIILGVINPDGGKAMKGVIGSNPLDSRLQYLLERYAVPAADYPAQLKQMEQYRVRFMQWFEHGEFDAILCPPYPVPALKHGTSHKFVGQTSYDMLYNLLQFPAGVVSITRVQPGEESDRPVATDEFLQALTEVEKGSAGLPVGVQIAARHWREDIVLSLMGILEQHFSGREDYPVLTNF